MHNSQLKDYNKFPDCLPEVSSVNFDCNGLPVFTTAGSLKWAMCFNDSVTELVRQ